MTDRRAFLGSLAAFAVTACEPGVPTAPPVRVDAPPLALRSITEFLTPAQLVDVESGAALLDVTDVLNTAFALPKQRIALVAGVYRVDGMLAPPVCAGILGEGQENTTLLAPVGGGVFLRLHGTGLSELADLRLDGSRSTGATGLLVGDAAVARWHGLMRNLRIEHFWGAGAVGLHVADTIKSLLTYVRVAENQTNVLCRNLTPGGYPTTTSFHRCECVNAVENGCVINNGESLVFDGCLFEGNQQRGVLVDTSDNKTVNNIHFVNGCWFEDNWHGATDPSGKYAMVVLAPAGTARASVRDAFFHANNIGKSLKFSGVGVSGFRCDNVQVPNMAGMIRVENGAWGVFDVWAPNLDQTTVVSYG